MHHTLRLQNLGFWSKSPAILGRTKIVIILSKNLVYVGVRMRVRSQSPMLKDRPQLITVASAKYIGFHDIFSEVGCTGDGNNPDDYSEGFIWADGTIVDYTNWAGGEPNDWNGAAIMGANCRQATDGPGGENRTVLNGRYQWQDVGCGGRKGYVCGMTASPQNIRPHDPNSCPRAQLSATHSLFQDPRVAGHCPRQPRTGRDCHSRHWMPGS